MFRHVGESKMCHALMFGLGILSPTGAGEAPVGSWWLESTALSTVVQRSPGRSNGHGWKEKMKKGKGMRKWKREGSVWGSPRPIENRKEQLATFRREGETHFFCSRLPGRACQSQCFTCQMLNDEESHQDKAWQYIEMLGGIEIELLTNTKQIPWICQSMSRKYCYIFKSQVILRGWDDIHLVPYMDEENIYKPS